MAPGYDLGAFDCGETAYNRWLVNAAEAAVKAGTAGVYLLVEEAAGGPSRVVGYYAICPTGVVRSELPSSVTHSMPDPLPGFLLAKMALDRSLRGDKEAMWGTQLVVAALRRIVQAAKVSGGRVIVVDADNDGLVPFYASHGFLPTKVHPLRLYMKVATARALIERYDDN
jgi:predicted GNAT family N-acyltransferase